MFRGNNLHSEVQHHQEGDPLFPDFEIELLRILVHCLGNSKLPLPTFQDMYCGMPAVTKEQS